MDRLHIFRAGCYVAMSGRQVCLSAADLAASANAYDPGRHRAPLVLGHPEHNAQAFGWTARLEAGAGDLYAFAQPDDSLRALVRAGRYGKLSASFWPPDHPENPAPGVWSLRHIGFLGAAVPAVLGLDPVSLAATPCTCFLEEARIETAARRMAGLPLVPAAFGAPIALAGQPLASDDPIEQAARRMAGLATSAY